MGKKFHAYFNSYKGIQYTVEIHDSAFSGTSTEFSLSGEGFTIQYDQENDLTPNIVPSSVTFGMLIEPANKTAIETLLDDLASAEDRRFQVVIWRDLTGTGATKFWVGNILTDTSARPDTSPGMVEITASDGLASLQNIEYKDTTGPYQGYDTILEHILKALKKVTALDTFYTTDVAIHTIANWYEQNHSTSTSDDPMALTRVRHERFYVQKSISHIEYSSAADVVLNICRRFFLRIYQDEGVFVIEQIPEREKASNTVRMYTKDGTYLTALSKNYDVTLDQVTEARLSGADFSWLSAYRNIREKYVNQERHNYLSGKKWTDSDTSEYTHFLEIETQTGNTTLGISGVHTRTFTRLAGYVDGSDIIAVFRMRLRVGDNYLRRNIGQISSGNITYESAEWTTDEAWYYFHYDYAAYNFPQNAGDSVVMPGLLSFFTPGLPSGGLLKAKIEHAGHRKKSDGSLVDDLSYSLTWEFSAMTCNVYSNGYPASITDYTWHTALNSNASTNSENYEHEVNIGDGKSINDLGKLQVFDGAQWLDSTGWRVGTSGSFLKIQDLTIQEIAGLRSKNLRRWDGTVYSSSIFRNRLYFDNSYWIALQASFSANRNEISGVWIEISRDVTGISIGNEEEFVNNDEPLSGLLLPPGSGNTPVANVAGSVAAAVSKTTLSADVPAGIITTLQTPALAENAFSEGDVISIVDTTTGAITQVTVTADTSAGDTTIKVQGYASDTIKAGSPIILTPKASSGGSSGGAVQVVNIDDITAFFEQLSERDDTNDQSWRIEVPDIVAETDEAAGDGLTAGLRFDGDGLQLWKTGSTLATVSLLASGVWELRTSGGTGSTGAGVVLGSDSGIRAFKSSSTTPTFYLKHTGELLLNYQGHPTVQAGIFYVNAGVIYLDHDGTGTKVHPQFGHIRPINALDFSENWATGYLPGFWRISSEYAGLEVYKWSLGVGSTSGSGTGTNTVVLWHQNSSGGTTTNLGSISTIGGSVKSTVATIGSPQILLAGDILYFEVTSVKSTPPQGAFIELYLRKS